VDVKTSTQPGGRQRRNDVLELLEIHGIVVEVVDERFPGAPIDVAFQGRLTPSQQEAAQALLVHDIGILSATTAFGKTVVATWLIAARKVNTLVLVHRRQLMDQWRERLGTFLDMPPGAIGLIGGGKNAPTGLIDIGIIQGVNRKGEVKDIVADYGQVIVDECHHISAFSFEQDPDPVSQDATIICSLVCHDGRHSFRKVLISSAIR